MGDSTEQVHPAGRKPPTPVCKATSVQRTQKTQLEHPQRKRPRADPGKPPQRLPSAGPVQSVIGFCGPTYPDDYWAN